MASSSFKPNKRGLDQMQRALQREFDKRPIRIPVEAEARPTRTFPAHDSATSPATVVHHQTVYQGPVVTVTGDNAQLAWSEGGDIRQEQSRPIAPGYDQLAVVLADVLARLDSLDINEDDREDARVSARQVLDEVVKDDPKAGIIRRGTRALKGILESFGQGAGSAAGLETVEWLGATVEQLTAALPSG